MYVVSMLPVLCRRPLSCTYVCVGAHKCIMRMYRAFHVSPWRHVSGVDPSLHSDSSGEREATAELLTVRGSHSHSLACRCDQRLAAIQLWKCISVWNHSVCVHVKGTSGHERVGTFHWMVLRFPVKFNLSAFSVTPPLEWHRKNFEQIILQTPGVTP